MTQQCEVVDIFTRQRYTPEQWVEAEASFAEVLASIDLSKEFEDVLPD